MTQYKVILYGCGVMGRKTAVALLDKKTFQIVGAVDIAEEFVGRDLGELLDPPRKTDVTVRNDADALLSEVKADAVILTTTSHLESVKEQMEQCARAGLNVISTCEELSYPWKRHPELAAQLDQLAKDCGVTFVGTGINPGYLMDTLPIVLTGPCLSVDRIQVTRMMDSSRRRLPFQKKVGSALSKEAFREKIDKGIITGHVGLLESINMIAGALKWELDEAVELPPEPVIAEKETETALGQVPPGDVVGLSSIAYAKMGGREVIRLEFIANAAVTEEYDDILVEGVPRIHQRILGGVHGDVGTVAVTVNTVPQAIEASAGLKTMKDLPPAAVTQ